MSHTISFVDVVWVMLSTFVIIPFPYSPTIETVSTLADIALRDNSIYIQRSQEVMVSALRIENLYLN